MALACSSQPQKSTAQKVLDCFKTFEDIDEHFDARECDISYEEALSVSSFNAVVSGFPFISAGELGAGDPIVQYVGGEEPLTPFYLRSSWLADKARKLASRNDAPQELRLKYLDQLHSYLDVLTDDRKACIYCMNLPQEKKAAALDHLRRYVVPVLAEIAMDTGDDINNRDMAIQFIARIGGDDAVERLGNIWENAEGLSTNVYINMVLAMHNGELTQQTVHLLVRIAVWHRENDAVKYDREDILYRVLWVLRDTKMNISFADKTVDLIGEHLIGANNKLVIDLLKMMELANNPRAMLVLGDYLKLLDPNLESNRIAITCTNRAIISNTPLADMYGPVDRAVRRADVTPIELDYAHDVVNALGKRLKSKSATKKDVDVILGYLELLIDAGQAGGVIYVINRSNVEVTERVVAILRKALQRSNYPSDREDVVKYFAFAYEDDSIDVHAAAGLVRELIDDIDIDSCGARYVSAIDILEAELKQNYSPELAALICERGSGSGCATLEPMLLADAEMARDPLVLGAIADRSTGDNIASINWDAWRTLKNVAFANRGSYADALFRAATKKILMRGSDYVRDEVFKSLKGSCDAYELRELSATGGSAVAAAGLATMGACGLNDEESLAFYYDYLTKGNDATSAAALVALEGASNVSVYLYLLRYVATNGRFDRETTANIGKYFVNEISMKL